MKLALYPAFCGENPRTGRVEHGLYFQAHKNDAARLSRRQPFHLRCMPAVPNGQVQKPQGI